MVIPRWVDWVRPTPLTASISGDFRNVTGFRNVTSQAFRNVTVTSQAVTSRLQPSDGRAMHIEAPSDIGLRLASL